MFISFEGLDGCGKTTQAAMLAAALELEGRTVVRVREPGGTPIGERIRELLLDGESVIGGAAEALLYAAARAQLVDQVILPALARGEVVVADRFIDSSLAYQGVARGLGLEQVLQANQLATGGLIPTRLCSCAWHRTRRCGARWIAGRDQSRRSLPCRRRGQPTRPLPDSRSHPRRRRGRPAANGAGARARGGGVVSGAFDGLPSQPGDQAARAGGGRSSHAYLLSGPRGAGKRRCAERFAASLLGSRRRIEAAPTPTCSCSRPRAVRS